MAGALERLVAGGNGTAGLEIFGQDNPGGVTVHDASPITVAGTSSLAALSLLVRVSAMSFTTAGTMSVVSLLVRLAAVLFTSTSTIGIASVRAINTAATFVMSGTASLLGVRVQVPSLPIQFQSSSSMQVKFALKVLARFGRHQRGRGGRR